MAKKRLKTGVQKSGNYSEQKPKKFKPKSTKPKIKEEHYKSPTIRTNYKRVRNDSEEHELYNKQMRRVRQFVYRAKKRGYVFPEDMIPQRPQYYTMADVEQLRRMTPAMMYEQARVYYNETEYYTGTEYRHMENVERGRKAYETRHFKQYDIEQKKEPTDFEIVERVRQMLENSHPTERWSNYSPHQKEAILIMFDEQESYLDDKFPEFLRQIETQLNDLINKIQNYNEDNNNLFQEILTLLNGGAFPMFMQDRIDELEMEYLAWEY